MKKSLFYAALNTTVTFLATTQDSSVVFEITLLNVFFPRNL